KTVIDKASQALYVPTGHLVYIAGRTLMAAPFDLNKLATTGGPVPMVESVRRMTAPGAAAQFGISTNGTLIYRSGPSSSGANQRLLGVIGPGTLVKRIDLPPRPYTNPKVSPDGQRIAFVID